MAITFINMLQYYYAKLSSKQKEAYIAIYRGMLEFKEEINIPAIPVDDASLVFNYILLDNPLLFYVTSFTYIYDSNNYTDTIKPSYLCTKNNMLQNIEVISRYLMKYDSIKSLNDIDKEFYVHDFCLANFSYDYSFGKHSHSIVGPIMNKTGVCEGISKYIKLVFDYIGIRSLIVTSRINKPIGGMVDEHAWNIVEINRNFYHLDVTFDMSITETQNRYDYFNLTDNHIAKDHEVPSTVPSCNSITNNYFVMKSSLLSNFTSVSEYMTRELRSGNKQMIFKLGFKYNENTIEQQILEVAKRVYSSFFLWNFNIEIRCNKEQGVIELNFS